MARDEAAHALARGKARDAEALGLFDALRARGRQRAGVPLEPGTDWTLLAEARGAADVERDVRTDVGSHGKKRRRRAASDAPASGALASGKGSAGGGAGTRKRPRVRPDSAAYMRREFQRKEASDPMMRVAAAKSAAKAQRQRQRQRPPAPQQGWRAESEAELGAEADSRYDSSDAESRERGSFAVRSNDAAVCVKSAVPFWSFGSTGAVAERRGKKTKKKKKNGKGSAERDANVLERLESQPNGRRRSLKATERRKDKQRKKKEKKKKEKKKRKKLQAEKKKARKGMGKKQKNK